MDDHDVEDSFHRVPTRPLSPEAVERIQSTLRSADSNRRPLVTAFLSRPVPLWKLAASVLAAAGIGAACAHRLHPAGRPAGTVASTNQPNVIVVPVPRTALFGGTNPLATARWSAGVQ